MSDMIAKIQDAVKVHYRGLVSIWGLEVESLSESTSKSK